MKNEIHIFDLDGCVIDSLHRYKTLNDENIRIDLEHWIENYTPEKISQDTLLPLAAYYKAQLENVGFAIPAERLISFILKHSGFALAPVITNRTDS